MVKKVVLAYSGGLDTSVAIRWLQERDYDVVALTIDLGNEKDLLTVEKRAYEIGAVKALVATVRSCSSTTSHFRR